VLQDTLRRLDKSYKAFSGRVKRGPAPGFPRFKGRRRNDSFTYPQSGFELSGKLQLSKIGNIKNQAAPRNRRQYQDVNNSP
jgi:putative transposase